MRRENPAVHFNVRLGHHTFETELYAFPSPLRRDSEFAQIETMFVGGLFVSVPLVAELDVVAVLPRSESLRLPARRNRDRRLLARAPSASHFERPFAIKRKRFAHASGLLLVCDTEAD